MPNEGQQRTSESELATLVLRDNAKLRADITEQLTVIEQRLTELVHSGFPENDDGSPDLNGHREYHKLLMEVQRKRIKMYDAIIEKTLTALLWVVIVFIGSALWTHVRGLLGK